MSPKLLINLLFLIFLIYTVSAKAPPYKCQRNWKKIGCYHDRIIPNRPYPYELVNHRDPVNHNWDGHLLDWREFPQSLHALACKCANLTKSKGYEYFGLQFFGECWSGPTDRFYRDGPSAKCIGGDFKSCDVKSETECVGKAFTNFIYRLSEEKTEEIVDGNWGEWSQWTPCSQKCNGGIRTRERLCNNPEPSEFGKSCEGEEEDSQACNEEECEEVCEKKLEVGVILDSSTSVNSRNWKRTLDFLVAFSKEFVISPTGVHFGVLHFAWRVYFDFAISDERYWTAESFEARVKAIKYRFGGTRTDLALKAAMTKFFCKDCKLRADIPKLLLVLTDGKSNYGTKNLSGLSNSLKKMGVKIMSIGVGSQIDEEELYEIATDESFVFLLDSYQYLQDKLNNMLKVSCKSASKSGE